MAEGQLSTMLLSYLNPSSCSTCRLSGLCSCATGGRGTEVSGPLGGKHAWRAQHPWRSWRRSTQAAPRAPPSTHQIGCAEADEVLQRDAAGLVKEIPLSLDLRLDIHAAGRQG